MGTHHGKNEEVYYKTDENESGNKALKAAMDAAVGQKEADKKSDKKSDPRSRRLNLDALSALTRSTCADKDEEVAVKKNDAVYGIGIGRNLADAEKHFQEEQVAAARKSLEIKKGVMSSIDARDRLLAAAIDETILSGSKGVVDDRRLKSAKEEYERLKAEEPSVFPHAQLSYLMRRIELAKDKIAEGVSTNADAYLHEAVAIKRFRFATESEKRATEKREKTILPHAVIGHSVMIVPLEITKPNKLLAESLIALVNAEALLFKQRSINKAASMKSRATITLTELLAGKVPADGVKPIVYLAAGAEKKIGKDGEVLYRASFQMLLEAKVDNTLHLLQVSGSEKVVALYEKFKKERRYLPISFVKVRRVSGIQGDDLFRDAKRFLADVLRGLDNETKELEKIAKASEKDAVTDELTEALEVSESAATKRLATDTVAK